MAARPPAFSLESTINHEGPFCMDVAMVSPRVEAADSGGRTYDLVEALGSTQARGAHADDENINVAAELDQSVEAPKLRTVHRYHGGGAGTVGRKTYTSAIVDGWTRWTRDVDEGMEGSCLILLSTIEREDR